MGVFTPRNYRITERTLRSDLRTELATSSVDVQSFVANVQDPVPGQEQTITQFQRLQNDTTKFGLGLDRALDLTRLFTVITEVPGWSRENIALVGEPTPLLVVADIVDVHDEGIDALRLNRIEPGNNIEIHLPRGPHTVAFKGTLVQKKIGVTDRVPYHRLTVWVHEERRLDLDTLVWDIGFWNEGVWA